MRIDRYTARAGIEAERARRRRAVQECVCGCVGPDGDAVRMIFHHARESADGTLTFTQREGGEEVPPAPVPERCSCGNSFLVYSVADRKDARGQALPPPPNRALTVTGDGELRFLRLEEIPPAFASAVYRGWPVRMDAEAIERTPGARRPTLAESVAWKTTLETTYAPDAPEIAL